MRLDQWLWAVRLYKTRGAAVEAIKAGRVKVNGAVVKPAREVREGEVVTARTGVITRTYRVTGAPKSRVAAKRVPEFAEDLTPPEEFERAREISQAPGFRARGEGRPTKRERRILDELAGE